MLNETKEAFKQATLGPREVEIDGEIQNVDAFDWPERPTPRTIALLRHTLAAFTALAGYLPASLRQVYYRMVGVAAIRNTVDDYRHVMRVLKNGRTAGLIPWEWMEDRTRTAYLPRVFEDRESYVRAELRWFLNDYRRDLLQSQESAVVLVSEKDALRPMFAEAAEPLGVPVWIVKGFSSRGYVKDLAEWIRNQNRGRNRRGTTILYAGDHDPSGLDIPRSIEHALRHQHNLRCFQLERVGLTHDQVVAFDLPTDPEAVKPKDPRRAAYVTALEELGIDASGKDLPAWELDALEPTDLVQILRDALANHIDQELIEKEKAQELEDERAFADLRERIEALVAGDE